MRLLIPNSIRIVDRGFIRQNIDDKIVYPNALSSNRKQLSKLEANWSRFLLELRMSLKDGLIFKPMENFYIIH